MEERDEILEQLEAILGPVTVDKAVTGSVAQDQVVKAPGMKYRHYAPGCPVIIVKGSAEKAAAYIRQQYTQGDHVLCFREELPLFTGLRALAYGSAEQPESLSAGLFDALRQLDKPGITRIFARCPVGGGIAMAVQNRLYKAAGFESVDAEEWV